MIDCRRLYVVISSRTPIPHMPFALQASFTYVPKLLYPKLPVLKRMHLLLPAFVDKLLVSHWMLHSHHHRYLTAQIELQSSLLFYKLAILKTLSCLYPSFEGRKSTPLLNVDKNAMSNIKGVKIPFAVDRLSWFESYNLTISSWESMFWLFLIIPEPCSKCIWLSITALTLVFGWIFHH